MPIVNPSGGTYPSIEDVNNAIRVHVNDTFAGVTNTVGEGRIYTDSWMPNITVLNLSLSRLQRDLENYGLPTTREVTFIIDGLTPINGPLGLGVPDPTVQVALSFSGYWDGSTLNANINLPQDLLVPLKVYQRQTGSALPFSEVCQAVDGLPSINQTCLLGWWNWITDQIVYNGSQNTMDIELRYAGTVPQYPTNLDPTLYPTTFIPFLDSMEALSYRCAYVFCSPRLPKGEADDLQANYESAMLQMANRYIKTMQRSPVQRGEFVGGVGNSYGGNSWSG